MFDLEKIVRENIQKLKPYSSAREEFTGQEGIFLDANENPFGKLNRYPDPYQKDLKSLIAKQKKVKVENVFLGNGSDEVIDLLFRIFGEPKQSKALTFSPTYGMYQVSADIHNIELLKVPLNADFQIDIEQTKPFLTDENLNMIFICSPNNPTGNIINTKDVAFLLQNFAGIVVIDEAYIDFGNTTSWIKEIEKYPNLVVTQTLSKAWGLASLRLGMAFTNTKIIHYLNKVKPPYNISGLNQKVAFDTLQDTSTFKENLNIILKEKAKFEKELEQIDFISKVYPSATNFFLIKVENANAIYEALLNEKVIIRNRHKVIENHLRITVGSPEENELLLKALKKIADEKSFIYR